MTDLYEDMKKLNYLYETLGWNHTDPLTFMIEGDRIVIRNLYQEQRDKDRQAVKDKKQLKDQEEIEKALFDYTVYPAALLRKDATLKAARTMDFVLSKGKKEEDSVGPVTIKSEYYDVSITKPRGPVLGWCMAIARKGLCTLYAEYFRQSEHGRCAEACGLRKHWSPMEKN